MPLFDFDSFFSDGEGDNRHFAFDSNTMRDPFEMHNFFEQRVSEIFKNFFGPDFCPDLSQLPNTPPSIKENMNPRDFYLKPEFNQSKDGDRKVQEDSSRKFLFGSLFPPENEKGTWTSSYRKTITFADGIVKSTEVIRNADGTEHRTESTTVLEGGNPPQLPFLGPGNSGPHDDSSSYPAVDDPKLDFLKPGYENCTPNTRKFDTDLDKEISISGIESLTSLSKDLQVPVVERKETINSPDQRTTGFLGSTARALKDVLDLLLR